MTSLDQTDLHRIAGGTRPAPSIASGFIGIPAPEPYSPPYTPPQLELL